MQAYEKTSALNVVVDSYPSVVRFIGHVQLKGVRPRTVEAYLMMVRLLALYAGQDPASLDEGSARVRHLLQAGEAALIRPEKSKTLLSRLRRSHEVPARPAAPRPAPADGIPLHMNPLPPSLIAPLSLLCEKSVRPGPGGAWPGAAGSRLWTRQTTRPPPRRRTFACRPEPARLPQLSSHRPEPEPCGRARHLSEEKRPKAFHTECQATRRSRK